MKLLNQFCVSCLVLFSLNACSEKAIAPVEENEAIVMARQVAEKMDTISTAIESITDYESVRASVTIIKKQQEELIQIYKDNQDLTADSGTIEEINRIIIPSRERLQKVSAEAKVKFKDNLPIKNALLISFTGISATFKEIQKIGKQDQKVEAKLEVEVQASKEGKESKSAKEE
jgi:uncharacterized protein YcfL